MEFLLWLEQPNWLDWFMCKSTSFCFFVPWIKPHLTLDWLLAEPWFWPQISLCPSVEYQAPENPIQEYYSALKIITR